MKKIKQTPELGEYKDLKENKEKKLLVKHFSTMDKKMFQDYVPIINSHTHYGSDKF